MPRADSRSSGILVLVRVWRWLVAGLLAAVRRRTRRPRTRRGMNRLPTIAFAVAVAASTTASATPAVANASDPGSYASLADEAASLADDDPAPSDWTISNADNSSSSHPGAFTTSTGRAGWFGAAWYDVDANGCDTRNDILGRDLSDVTYKGRSTCTVATGVLEDPYTGDTIDFTRGEESSRAVQVDHVIPLGFIYAHGGWAWDADTRLEVANDPLNLLAVDGRANASKSDSGPATSPSGSGSGYLIDGGGGWMPRNRAYTCPYAARFTQVAAKYRLGVGDADAQKLASILTDCASGDDAARTPDAHETSGPPAAPGLGRVTSLIAFPPGLLELGRRLATWIEEWSVDHPACTVGIALVLLLAAAEPARRRYRR